MKTEERLQIFGTSVQDIRDLKANQWRFSHYGLLIQAALVAVDVKLETIAPFLIAGGLTVVSVLTFHLILTLIHEHQEQIVYRVHTCDSMSVPRRETMLTGRRKFGSRAQKRPCRPWERYPEFERLFFRIQVLGMLIAILVIWSPSAACSP